MPIKKDSLNGDTPVKPERKKLPVMPVLVVCAALLGVGGFVTWKKHESAGAFHPSPMTVNTNPSPHAASHASRGHAGHGPGVVASPSAAAPPASPIQSVQAAPDGNFVNATPAAGGAVAVAPSAQAAAPVYAAQPAQAPQGAPGQVPAAVVAQWPLTAPAPAPASAQVEQSLQAQNQAYYSQTAVLNREIAMLTLQYQVAKMENKIRRETNPSAQGAPVNLPPAPAPGPAPSSNGTPTAGVATSNTRLAQSLVVPFQTQGGPTPSSALLSIAHGAGGPAAVVLLGGNQYTVREGDWVGGMRVVSIGSRQVVLGAHGQHEVLSLEH